MQSKIYKFIAILFITSTTLYANEILSQQRIDSLDLSKEQAIQESKKLKVDWINPITYTYSHNNGDISTKKSSTISINQPIFRSGGIYNAIKYAKNIKTSSDLTIDLQKKALILEALNIAFNIKKLDFQIQKQKLNLDNAQIDLEIKQESVFNGLLDTSFLNNAILAKNNIQASLLDLEYQKKSLQLSFGNLSSKKPQEIELPKFSKIDFEHFEKQNLQIEKAKAELLTKENLKGITAARYLPAINVNYSKTFNHDEDENTHIYGLNVVVPFDLKGYYDTSASKISYLKAKKDFEILKTEEKNFFHTKSLMLDNIDSKIKLTKNNINVYNELLEQTIELVNTGIKTSNDKKILENSKNSELLNLKIYEIDKQLQLLELYGKIR